MASIAVKDRKHSRELREVRRALFSSAVLRARRRARQVPISKAEVAAEVKAVRGRRST